MDDDKIDVKGLGSNQGIKDSSIKKDYLEQVVAKFIREELSKGYSLDQIKSELRDLGHSEALIEDAIAIVLGSAGEIKLDTSILKNELDKDFLKYTVHELKNYIKDRLRHNVDINTIKKNLKALGHDEKLIEKSIEECLFELNKKKILVNFQYLSFLLPIFFYYLTYTNPVLILFAFLPIFASIFFSRRRNNDFYLPFALVFVHAIFSYLFGLFRHTILQIFSLNLVFSYLVWFLAFERQETESKKQKPKLKPLASFNNREQKSFI